MKLDVTEDALKCVYCNNVIQKREQKLTYTG